MKRKKLLGVLMVVLLVVVLLSLVYVVLRAVGRRRATTPGGEGIVSSPLKRGHRVIVFYFYDSRRSPNCRLAEIYTRQALRMRFQDAMDSGAMIFREVNIDDPAEGGFRKEYDLSGSAVVISDQWEGQQKSWKKLVNTEALVGDRDSFNDYIQKEVLGYVND